MMTRKMLASILAATGLFASTGYAALAQTSGTTNGTTNNSSTQNDTRTYPDATQNVPVTKPGRSQDDPALIRGGQPSSDQTQNNAVQSNQYNNLSAQDFVMRAGQANLAEIQLSQLALQKTSNDSVKQYAQEMIRDHTRAGQALGQIASNKGMTLPSDTDATHKATYSRLQQLNGTNFDQAYLSAMKQDHSNAVFLFQAQAQQGQDPDLRAFASSQLPVFQSHLAMSQNLTSVASNTLGQSDVNTSSNTATDNSSTTGTSTNNSSSSVYSSNSSTTSPSSSTSSSTTQGSESNTTLSQGNQTGTTNGTTNNTTTGTTSDTTNNQGSYNTTEPVPARW